MIKEQQRKWCYVVKMEASAVELNKRGEIDVKGAFESFIFREIVALSGS